MVRAVAFVWLVVGLLLEHPLREPRGHDREGIDLTIDEQSRSVQVPAVIVLTLGRRTERRRA